MTDVPIDPLGGEADLTAHADGEGELIGVTVEPILGLGEPPCGLLNRQEAILRLITTYSLVFLTALGQQPTHESALDDGTSSQEGGGDLRGKRHCLTVWQKTWQPSSHARGDGATHARVSHPPEPGQFTDSGEIASI